MLRLTWLTFFLAILALVNFGCEFDKEVSGTTPAAVTNAEKPAAATPATDAPPGEKPGSLPAAPTAAGRPASQHAILAPFREPLEPNSFELASGALTVWRTYASAKPKLLLFASHPLLNPIPKELQSDIARLIASASDQQLIRRGGASASDTLLVSPQTVSAAISAGLISELVVALPRKEKPNRETLERFRALATSSGFLTEREGATLHLAGATITGTVRGLPLRIVHPEALPKLDGPLIVHIDLSYFRELYNNEVKTPIYDLIHDFATSIREIGYRPVAITLSFSNQEVGLALPSRFVIRDVADLLRNPEYLKGGAPASWTRRAAAMYASVMLDQAKAVELAELAAKETPDDAAALFDLALVRFQQARADEGFALLDRAVALDRGYALAYIELADRGQEMGQWRKSFELLQKAVTVFPDNDELRVRLAGDLIQRGRSPEARPILEQLLKQTWSPHYHPGMVETLDKMREAAKADSILPLADEPEQADGQQPSRSMPPSHMSIPMHRPLN